MPESLYVFEILQGGKTLKIVFSKWPNTQYGFLEIRQNSKIVYKSLQNT